MRSTFWVFHQSGTLQVSNSLLITDSAWDCSIPHKKAQVASPLEWAFDILQPVLKGGWQLLQAKRWLAAHPMRAEDIPLKRHSDICRGTTAYAYVHSLYPTQEAFWYLPWNCYLIHSLSDPLIAPLKRQHCQLRGGPLILAPVVTISYPGHKPTRAHLLDSTVNCHGPFTLIIHN